MSEKVITELESTEPAPSLPTVNFCKNCQTDVSSLLYCPVCGQKSDTHILTFRELLAEFSDGLFNMDSRLWRTLIPLIARPGKLTNEFIHGRRMYFLPPFRLYLILSVLFFLIPYDRSFFSEESFNSELTPEQAAQIQESLGPELASELASEFASELNNQQETEQTSEEICLLENLELNSFLKSLFQEACLNINEDPQSILDAMADSLSILLIISIPLVALVMQLLYLFSRRRYVEHVVFLLHAHAFFFLISITMAITSLLGLYYPALLNSMNILRILAAWYLPIYMLLALNRVYGGSKLAIFSKAMAITISYVACFGIVMLLGAFFTALSV